MSEKCSHCGETPDLSYTCAQCGESHCYTHNKPESHNCPSLGASIDPDEMADDWVSRSEDSGDAWAISSSTREAISRNDNSLDIPLLGNVTTTLVAICVLVFSLQWAIYPLVGFSVGSEMWLDTFVLQSSEPLHIWTWITSVFSHGGIIHLVVNSFVILMFGTQAEKILGQRDYLSFFIFSGIVSGLLYVGAALAVGQSVSVLGASGAASAIFGLLAVTRPNIQVLLFFIIPMSIKTMTILLIVVSLGVVGIFGMGAFGVAHIAHVAGLLFGVGYGRWHIRR